MELHQLYGVHRHGDQWQDEAARNHVEHAQAATVGGESANSNPERDREGVTVVLDGTELKLPPLNWTLSCGTEVELDDSSITFIEPGHAKQNDNSLGTATSVYVADESNSVAVSAPNEAPSAPRPMTGFFKTLSPAQQESALAYRGPETHGDSEFANDNFTLDDARRLVGLAKADYRAAPEYRWDDEAGDLVHVNPYISTLNGRFYLNDPKPEDVDIVHIAHALAMSCRYTGATQQFYSTAEHSVHMARWLAAQGHDAETQTVALLHDAPETLSGFGDVARPRKKMVPLIGEVEAAIWEKAIAPKYELPLEMPEAVHEADMRICADEMEQNMHEVDPNVGPPLGVTLEYWTPQQAKVKFLALFMSLQRKRQQEARRAA